MRPAARARLLGGLRHRSSLNELARFDTIRRTARSLQLDMVTAQVVSALDKQGVRSIVLKGPSIRRLLYADGAERSYIDSDLLVAPDCVSAARKVLREFGFTKGVRRPGRL